MSWKGEDVIHGECPAHSELTSYIKLCESIKECHVLPDTTRIQTVCGMWNFVYDEFESYSCVSIILILNRTRKSIRYFQQSVCFWEERKQIPKRTGRTITSCKKRNSLFKNVKSVVIQIREYLVIRGSVEISEKLGWFPEVSLFVGLKLFQPIKRKGTWDSIRISQTFNLRENLCKK